MKRELLLPGLLAAAGLCGCTSDDIIDKTVENPVHTGQEILFGSSASGDGAASAAANSKAIGARTTYGPRTQTGIPVYWADGDNVAIFCAQASQPANRLVNYTITPQESNPSLSASVTKVGDTGLQWGTADEHRFYAFYPASAVKGTAEENKTGKITANIPVTQQPSSWIEDDLDGAKTYFGLPNMNYAYMYAYTSEKKSETPVGKAIDLQFKNLVTVLDITVQGPEANTSPVTVTNINVKAVNGTKVILTGDFSCNIKGAEDNSTEVSAVCEAAGDLNAVRNTISIPCYNSETKNFITLNPGEQLNVKAYLIPDEDHIIEKQQLQITVATQNGSANVKTLATADVTPYKVNRVRLPKLVSGGTDYWMTNLDPNIYVTELSWPGSKMSLLTERNNANIVYQTTDIGQQLTDGVRAFIFQTQRTSNGTLYLTANNSRLDITLSDGLKQIADFLTTAQSAGKKESAFVLVTYYQGSGGESEWFNSLQSTISTCANDASYRIFNGALAPNTTLGDVANKIIVKANYNSTGMIANAGTAPMLYTLWNTPYVEGGVPMTWNNPNGNTAFTWMYQEVTSVLDDSRNVCGNKTYSLESTKANKRQYVQHIFEKSVDAYKNNDAHDTWFMNDLGGYYGYCSNRYSIFGIHTHSPQTDVPGLTQDMNALGIQLLQERKENAALGCVFLNFANNETATGVAYRSNDLISTIIDNNFKFALRKASDNSSAANSRTTKTATGNADEWDK